MMDNGNWRPTPQGGGGRGSGELAMEADDWRAQLPQESRQRIVNKIMETLKKHLPVSGPDGLSELDKIAVRFEEKIYTAATSQEDYLRKISLKMLTMETKSQNTIPNSLPPNAAGSSSKPPEQGLQQEVPYQSLSISNSLAPGPSQTRQQLLSQNIRNNIPPAGVQGSSSLSYTLPPVSGLGQNTNVQNMSNVSQNLIGNPMAQGLASNMFVNSQGQMLGRQQVVAQQQNLQNSQQYLRQLQQQFIKQKLQQGNMSHSIMSSQLPQQQQQMLQPQQSMLQLSHLQSHQQSHLQTPSVMPLSTVQQAPPSGPQQNQQSCLQQSTESMLQQHIGQQQQSQVAVRQQQPSPLQQPMLTSQQQQLVPMDLVDQPGHANGGDWQEEVYQKIKSMKEMYLPEINEVYHKIATKLQQHNFLPQQLTSDQFEKLKTFKTMLERIISFLQVSKNDVLPIYEERLASYEEQINKIINANRPRENPAQQQGQVQQPVHPFQQRQAQRLMSQVQPHQSQMYSLIHEFTRRQVKSPKKVEGFTGREMMLIRITVASWILVSLLCGLLFIEKGKRC